MAVDDRFNAGSSRIEQYGGPAGNIMDVAGTKGDDRIAIYGGEGKDSIIYDLTSGNDSVIVNGGGDIDTLTVNRNFQMNFTIKSSSGATLFTSGTGGTIITVVNVEPLKVLGEDSTTIIFQWDAP